MSKNLNCFFKAKICIRLFNESSSICLVLQCFFLHLIMGKLANVSYHLMVSYYRCPWIPSIPVESQVLCRPLGGVEGYGVGDSGILTHLVNLCKVYLSLGLKAFVTFVFFFVPHK